MRAWVATRNSKANLVQEAHMILLVKVILAVMKQLKWLLKLSAKFDSPVEHQNVSLLATAHDYETGLLQPMRGSSSQSSLLMLSGGLSVVLQASHLFQSTLYVVYCLALWQDLCASVISSYSTTTTTTHFIYTSNFLTIVEREGGREGGYLG